MMNLHRHRISKGLLAATLLIFGCESGPPAVESASQGQQATGETVEWSYRIDLSGADDPERLVEEVSTVVGLRLNQVEFVDVVVEPAADHRLMVRVTGEIDRATRESLDRIITTPGALQLRRVADEECNDFFEGLQGELPEGFSLTRVTGDFVSVTHRQQAPLKDFFAVRTPENRLAGFGPVTVYETGEDGVVRPDETQSYWETYLLLDEVVLSNAHLASASAASGNKGVPYVALDLNDEGRQILDALIEDHRGVRLAIAIDDTVYGAPLLLPSPGAGDLRMTPRILGHPETRLRRIEELAIILDSGPLPAPVLVESK